MQISFTSSLVSNVWTTDKDHIDMCLHLRWMKVIDDKFQKFSNTIFEPLKIQIVRFMQSMDTNHDEYTTVIELINCHYKCLLSVMLVQLHFAEWGSILTQLLLQLRFLRWSWHFHINFHPTSNLLWYDFKWNISPSNNRFEP